MNATLGALVSFVSKESLTNTYVVYQADPNRNMACFLFDCFLLQQHAQFMHNNVDNTDSMTEMS